MRGEPLAIGRTFLAAWNGDDDVDPGRLGAQVCEALDAGQTQWRGVPLAATEFAVFLAARVEPGEDPIAALGRLRADDLYLACACLHGSESAATRFRDHVFSTVRHAVARVAADTADDVMHRLYDRLFLADDDAAPKIDGYKGSGDIRRWVSVVACRIAIDGRRREQTEDRLKTQAFGRLVEQMQTLELEYLRGVYREEFREAFAQAVESLDERQRNVLRYQLEGLTADQVGRLYNVHRVTVARWLSRIRETLFENTRAALRTKLGLDAREADSILRLVDGEVSLSLGRLLASP